MNSSPIKEWQGKNIMIIGDVMLDRYLYGNINRISPEAPVPIVDLNHNYDRLGGAANVALNIKALGAIPYIFGAIGKDGDAYKFLELLTEESIDNTDIIHDDERQTTVKTRVWASNKQILRLDQETTSYLSVAKEQLLWQNIQVRVNRTKIHAIVLQDYNKGVLGPFIIKQTIALAKKMQIPVIVDPKSKHFFAYEGANLFKPNLKEIREQTDFDISPESIKDLGKASQFLRSKLNHDISMITLSENGIYLDDKQNQLISPTQKRQIIDVCGAGDTVLSIAALVMTTQTSLEVLGVLANIAGGQVCESIGVTPVSLEKLEQEFELFQKKSAHKK